MKKVSCFLGVFLCSALYIAPLISSAQAEALGEALFKPCASCHTDQKRVIFGKSEGYLLEKFAYYQGSKFTAMKKLFDAMSAEEKASLAKYIENVK